MAIKITQNSVRQLGVKETAYTVADTQVSHLRIKVHPTGRKVYFFQFKENGKQFKGTFGNIDQMTADDARRLAREKRAGVDLFFEKPSGSVTVEELAQAFLFEFNQSLTLSGL